MDKSNLMFYRHICRKYPNINYEKGENLNIENMKAEYLKDMWYDKKRYIRISDIASKLSMSERQLHRMVKNHKLISRHQIK
jgi:AraC-like DNA-binding protein